MGYALSACLFLGYVGFAVFGYYQWLVQYKNKVSTLDIIATLRKALKLSDSAQLSVHPSGAVNHVYRLQNVALHYEGTERKLQFHSDSEKAFRHRQTGQVVEGEQNQGRDPKQSCCVGDFAVKWLGDDRFSGIDRTYQFALQKNYVA